METISLQRPFSCFLFKHSLIIPFRCSLTLIVKLLTCKFDYLDCNLHAAFVTNENLQVSRKCISKCTDVPPPPTSHPLICGNTIRCSFLECVPIKLVIKLSWKSINPSSTKASRERLCAVARLGHENYKARNNIPRRVRVRYRWKLLPLRGSIPPFHCNVSGGGRVLLLHTTKEGKEVLLRYIWKYTWV